MAEFDVKHPLVGRPTKYTVDMGDKLVLAMSEGYSITAAAAKLGIVRETVYDWGRKHEKFSDAIKLGTELSQLWWEEKMMNNLKLPHLGGSFNSACWIFTMKNRFGWADQQRIEAIVATVKDVKDVNDMEDKDLKESYIKEITGTK